MVKIWKFFSFLLIIWLDCPQRLKMCPKIFLKNVCEFARSFASKRKKSADRKTFQKNWPEKGLFWGQNDVTKSRKLCVLYVLGVILKHFRLFLVFLYVPGGGGRTYQVSAPRGPDLSGERRRGGRTYQVSVPRGPDLSGERAEGA